MNLTARANLLNKITQTRLNANTQKYLLTLIPNLDGGRQVFAMLRLFEMSADRIASRENLWLEQFLSIY